MTEFSDEEIEITIESKDKIVLCPLCSSKAKVKDTTPVKLIDSTSFGRRVRIIWMKKRFYCSNTKCDQKSWVEVDNSIAFSRLVLTDRAARYVTKQVGYKGRSVTELAKELGCSWNTVNNAVIAYGTALVDDPNRDDTVRALGMDEVLFVREGEYKQLNFSTDK